MRISDWSSDVCSSDLLRRLLDIVSSTMQLDFDAEPPLEVLDCVVSGFFASRGLWAHQHYTQEMVDVSRAALEEVGASRLLGRSMASLSTGEARRSEEHTSEIQSLMRNSYAVFCLKKKMRNEYINRVYRKEI